MNKRDPEAVIKHVDSGSMAVNQAVVVEYMKALVRTDRISKFSGDSVVK